MLDLCRICLYGVSKTDCVSLFRIISDNKSALEIMKECTSIQILYEDGLPKYICPKCAEKLHLLYGFRNLIINSDLQLKEKLKTKTECVDSASQAVARKEESFTSDHCLISDAKIKIEECMLIESSIDENYKDFLEQSNANNLEQLDIVTKDAVTVEIITEVSDTRTTSKSLKSSEVPNNLQKLQTKLGCLNSVSQAVVEKEGNFTKHNGLASDEEFKIEQYTSNVSSVDATCKDFSRQKMKLYECKDCSKTFKTAKGFNNHNASHGIGTPFSCLFCNKTFRRKWALNNHTRKHTGEKPFTCDVCQKSFGVFSSLFIHKKIHTGEKKFNCDVCNKGFYHSSGLKNHMRKHTGEKPFMCEICSKTFGDHSILIKHKQRHQEQLMPCPICDKTYKGLLCLQQHMKRHSGLKPFSCNECGQKFTEQTSLRRHMLLHAGIKPYQCKICEKSFSQSHILVRHIRIHSGEKPFRCTLCPKEFTYKHHLQGHMKTQHKDAFEESDSIMSDDSQKETESTHAESALVT